MRARAGESPRWGTHARRVRQHGVPPGVPSHGEAGSPWRANGTDGSLLRYIASQQIQHEDLSHGQSQSSFFRRIGLAFSVLFGAELAGRLVRLREEAAATDAEAEASAEVGAEDAAAPARPAIVPRDHPEAALQLLGLLQRDARFIDFVQEDIGAYSDADIGAAARVVHEGCRKVLDEHFAIAPVRSEAEGSRPHPARKASTPRPCASTGKVVGKPPFTGTLGHRGWRVTDTACRRWPKATTPA